MTDYLTWKRAYWGDFLGRIELTQLLSPPEKGVAPVITTRNLAEELQAQRRVLDAGCGPAGIFLVLEACNVDAVDPLLDRYRQLPHFQPNAAGWVSWFAQPLETFAPTTGYDYVFCLNVINHVRDVGQVLRVLAKALRPDGRLILSVDAHRYQSLKAIFSAVPGDVLHPHQFDLEDYEKLCRESGLEVCKRLCFKQESIFSYWVLTLKLAA